MMKSSILENIINEIRAERKIESNECEIVGIRPSPEIFNMIKVLSMLHNKPFTTIFSNKISEQTAVYFANLMGYQEGIDLYCEVSEKIPFIIKDTAFDFITMETSKDNIEVIPSNKSAVRSKHLYFEEWFGEINLLNSKKIEQ